MAIATPSVPVGNFAQSEGSPLPQYKEEYPRNCTVRTGGREGGRVGDGERARVRERERGWLDQLRIRIRKPIFAILVLVVSLETGRGTVHSGSGAALQSGQALLFPHAITCFGVSLNPRLELLSFRRAMEKACATAMWYILFSDWYRDLNCRRVCASEIGKGKQ